MQNLRMRVWVPDHFRMHVLACMRVRDDVWWWITSVPALGVIPAQAECIRLPRRVRSGSQASQVAEADCVSTKFADRLREVHIVGDQSKLVFNCGNRNQCIP